MIRTLEEWAKEMFDIGCRAHDEAGLPTVTWEAIPESHVNHLLWFRLAEYVQRQVAKERETCAEIAEEFYPMEEARGRIATAIRARSTP